MWWVCVCLSSMTRPHEVHSVMLRPAAAVVHRPCDGPAEQYGHFISDEKCRKVCVGEASIQRSPPK